MAGGFARKLPKPSNFFQNRPGSLGSRLPSNYGRSLPQKKSRLAAFGEADGPQALPAPWTTLNGKAGTRISETSMPKESSRGRGWGIRFGLLVGVVLAFVSLPRLPFRREPNPETTAIRILHRADMQPQNLPSLPARSDSFNQCDGPSRLSRYLAGRASCGVRHDSGEIASRDNPRRGGLTRPLGSQVDE